jgi:outer membrane immunogenic protein
MKRVHLAGICAAAFVALVSPVHAADAPIAKAPPPAAAAVGKGPVPIFDWSGFYVGVQGGYGWGDVDICDNGGCLRPFDIKGWHGGGTLGWNWQSGMWVAGIEADFSFANIDGSRLDHPGFGCGDIDTCAADVKRFATLRGRVGPVFGSTFAYVTGGFAHARLSAALVGDNGASTSSKSGWTWGLGLETVLAPNWTGKIEWLYLRGFDDVVASTECGAGDPCRWVDPKFHVVRIGLNYRFATGKAPAAPIVTKN